MLMKQLVVSFQLHPVKETIRDRDIFKTNYSVIILTAKFEEVLVLVLVNLVNRAVLG